MEEKLSAKTPSASAAQLSGFWGKDSDYREKLNVAGLTDTQAGLMCSVTLARSWMGAVLIGLTWALSFPLI